MGGESLSCVCHYWTISSGLFCQDDELAGRLDRNGHCHGLPGRDLGLSRMVFLVGWGTETVTVTVCLAGI